MIRHTLFRLSIVILAVVVVAGFVAVQRSGTAFAVQNPQSGSLGIEGTIPSPPPSLAPTIATPSNGQTFTSTPITVAGLCTKGLLVKVFSNNIFIGSEVCADGSYSIQVDLFSGRNDLVADQFDALDQSSPNSNIVTVTFNAPVSNSGSSILFLTSDYAERGANPGQVLTWPITINGGTAPYAVSVDWGDGSTDELLSEQFSGTVNLTHVYSTAGTYTILIKAVDKNGDLAFLQVVGVANGAVISNAPNTSNKGKSSTIVRVLWIPAALTVILIPIAFWLGRRYELAALRKHLEHLR
jgi:hypothetical protein